MKGKEFLDEDFGYHDEWWDYYLYDNYYYFDYFCDDAEFKTNENGLVDWSDYLSTHLKRQHKLDEILGESLDIKNNIGKFWPKDAKN